MDPDFTDSAGIFADPLKFRDGDESTLKAKDADALGKAESHIAFKEVSSLITIFLPEHKTLWCGERRSVSLVFWLWIG